MKLKLHLRKLKKSDMTACVNLFRDTVHAINKQDYTSSQLNAWAPKNINMEDWWKNLSNNIVYVAEYNKQIIGFGEISSQGYFDKLFVHKNFQRKGVALALIKKLEEEIKILGIKEIYAEVSITAKPLAESVGYYVCEQQAKEFNGEKFINFIMRKKL